MMANKEDVAFHLGSTWSLTCECKNDDGSLVNLAQAEWRLAGTALLLKRTSAAGDIVITNPGICKVTVPLSAQTTIPAGVYDHELWVLDTNGVESVQIIGTAHIVTSLKKRFP